MRYISRLTALLLAIMMIVPTLLAAAETANGLTTDNLTLDTLDALYAAVDVNPDAKEMPAGVLGATVTLNADWALFSSYTWTNLLTGETLEGDGRKLEVPYTMQAQSYKCTGNGFITGTQYTSTTFVIPPAQTTDMEAYLEFLFTAEFLDDSGVPDRTKVYDFVTANWDVILADGANLCDNVVRTWMNEPAHTERDAHLLCTCVASYVDSDKCLLHPDDSHLPDCPWFNGVEIIVPDVPDSTPIYDYVGNPDGHLYTQVLNYELGFSDNEIVKLPTDGQTVLVYTGARSANRQWQVFTGEDWADIMGQTAPEIALNNAMLDSIFALTGSARLRYIDKGSSIVLTSVVVNSVAAELSAAAQTLGLTVQNRVEPGELSTGSVVVQYMYMDEKSHLNNTSVRMPNTWTVPHATGLHTSVTIPNVRGYEAYIPDGGKFIYEPAGQKITFEPIYEGENNTGRITGLKIDTDAVTATTVTVTIPYRRAEVGFTVNRLLEKPNITNTTLNEETDYAPAEDVQDHEGNDIVDTNGELVESVVPMTGKTEDLVGGSLQVEDGNWGYTNDDLIAPAINGFRRAVYKGETPIAADGKTSINVFYDRSYYLVGIDDNGGYGAKPVYAKYGATVSVQDPERAGYTFNGWQPMTSDNTVLEVNGKPAPLVKSLANYVVPAQDVHFKADWVADTTATLTVVFWGENPNDENYSVMQVVTAGAEVSKEGETITYPSNSLVVCGHPAHQHDASCGTGVLDCKHEHVIGCYSTGSNYASSWTRYNDVPDRGNNTLNTLDGATYYRSGNYCYIHINSNDTWYYVNYGWSATYYTPSVSMNSCHPNHDVNCYDYSCGLWQHEHVQACHTYEIDSNLWTHVSGTGDSVAVKPDDTSVLNVYFDRVEYQVNFYENATVSSSTGNVTAYRDEYTDIRITEKWGASILDQWPTKNGSSSWIVKGTTNNRTWQNSMQIMPVGGAKFFGPLTGNATYTATYFVEVVPGESGTVHNGVTYKEHHNDTSVSSGDVTEEEQYAIEGFTYKEGTEIGSSFGGATFYYTRNSYLLEFYNYDHELTDKRETVKYEAPLASYKFDPPYPDNLPKIDGKQGEEAEAYKFVGWYMDQTFQQPVDWDSLTMPVGPVANDTALVLYAKWEPKTFKVRFFASAGDMDKYEKGKTAFTDYDPKGETLPAAIKAELDKVEEDSPEYWTILKDYQDEYVLGYNPDNLASRDPQTNAPIDSGYQMVAYNTRAGSISYPKTGGQQYGTPIGWFYQVNGQPYAFDFSMPITEDMDLYVEYATNVNMPYVVRYIEAVKDTEGKYVPAFDGGTPMFVADDEVGLAALGTQQTLKAKYGDQLKVKNYFPLINSHTITIETKPSGDTDDWITYVLPGTNTPTDVQRYIFLYIPIQPVYYTVHYITATMPDGWKNPEPMVDGVQKLGTVEIGGTTYYKLMPDKYEKTENKYIVTETYKPVDNYMPNKYQEMLVLTATESENVINFIYEKNTTQAMMRIVHYVKNPNAGDYTMFLEVDDQIMLRNDQETEDFPTALMTANYSFVGAKLTYIDKNGTTQIEEIAKSGDHVANNQLTYKVPDASAALLELYYDPPIYPYTVEYLEVDAEGKPTGKAVAATKLGNDSLGKVVTEAAKVIDGYTLYSAKVNGYDQSYDATKREVSMTIAAEADKTTNEQNRIVFYYVQQQVTFNYVAVQYPLADCGTVALNKDTATFGRSQLEQMGVLDTTNAVGAKVQTKNAHFEFYNWYPSAKAVEGDQISLNSGRNIQLLPADNTATLDPNTLYVTIAADGTLIPQKTVEYEVYDPKAEGADENGMVTVLGYPVPADGTGTWNLYARFTYNTYTLKIVKAGLNADESAIFTVTAVSALDPTNDDNTEKTQEYWFALTGSSSSSSSSSSFGHLIGGTGFTIQEHLEWSWTYEDNVTAQMRAYVNGAWVETTLERTGDGQFVGALPSGIPDKKVKGSEIVTITITNKKSTSAQWLHDEGMITNHMLADTVKKDEGGDN